MFQEVTFYYDPQNPDFMELNSKISAHGGHMTGYSHVASMKLARVPFFEEDDYYDAIYIDDCIAAGTLLDKDGYYISRLIGVAFVDSTLNYAERKALYAERARVGLEPRRTPRWSLLSRERSRSPQRMPAVPANPPPKRPFREEPITRFDDPFIIRGRDLYDDEDDFRILDFVHDARETLKYSANGTQLWVYAKSVNLIPGRSDQSLRGRYLKFLRPQINEKRQAYVDWKIRGGSWRNPYK